MSTEEEEIQILRSLNLDFIARDPTSSTQSMEHAESSDEVLNLLEWVPGPVHSIRLADPMTPADSVESVSLSVVGAFDRALRQLLLENATPRVPRNTLIARTTLDNVLRILYTDHRMISGRLSSALEAAPAFSRARALVPVQFSDTTFPSGHCAICLNDFKNTQVVYVPCRPRTCPLCRAVF